MLQFYTFLFGEEGLKFFVMQNVLYLITYLLDYEAHQIRLKVVGHGLGHETDMMLVLYVSFPYSWLGKMVIDRVFEDSKLLRSLYFYSFCSKTF